MKRACIQRQWIGVACACATLAAILGGTWFYLWVYEMHYAKVLAVPFVFFLALCMGCFVASVALAHSTTSRALCEQAEEEEERKSLIN